MRKILSSRIIIGLIVVAVAIASGFVYSQYRQDMTLAYQRISNGGKVVETACGPIQYTEFGEGAPMLMVHGAGGGYDQGEYFAKLIDPNYRWIVPSRFGFLGSPIPEDANSSLQADYYACLLDSLGIEQVGVVGVSMGGPSSLLFAAQYPERTRVLAMISAASHALPERPAIVATLFEVFLNDFVFWSMVKLSPEGLLAALGVPMDVQAQLPPEEVAELHAFLDSIVPMGARESGQLLEQHMSEYDAEQVKSIQAPAIVLHARDDTLVFFDQGEFTAENVPEAELIAMERGGHLALMMGMNAGAMEVLRDFLKVHNP